MANGSCRQPGVAYLPTGTLAEHPPSLKLRRDKDARPSHGHSTFAKAMEDKDAWSYHAIFLLSSLPVDILRK